jgi:hypothetical protein
MKISQIKILTSCTLAVIMFSSTLTFANLDDKTTDKTREAVESASPHDWYTLAVSAEKCFKKKVNMKEAYAWLEESLEIAETPFNLELKGDYYNQNKLPEKAVEYYVYAMLAMKENNGSADVKKLQRKVAKLTNLGG